MNWIKCLQYFFYPYEHQSYNLKKTVFCVSKFMNMELSNFINKLVSLTSAYCLRSRLFLAIVKIGLEFPLYLSIHQF